MSLENGVSVNADLGQPLQGNRAPDTTIYDLEHYFGDQVDLELDFQPNPMEFMKWFYYESPCSRNGNEVKHEAVAFVMNLVNKLNLQDSPLFVNEELQEYLISRIGTYSHYLERQIERFKAILRTFQSDSFAKFQPGWQDRIKKAAYLAFLLHFGAKRRSEKDSNKPECLLDYIYHVSRSAFRVAGNRVMFLDENLIIALLFHDLLEDSSKGLFRTLVLEADFDPKLLDDLDSYKKSGALAQAKALVKTDYEPEIVAALRDEISKINDTLPDNLDMAAGVEMVTKNESLVGGRPRAFLNFLSQVKEQDFPQMCLGLMIKFCDRADNAETYGKGSDETDPKVIQIEREILVMMDIMKQTGLRNLYDHLCDFIYFKHNVVEREKILERFKVEASALPELDRFDRELSWFAMRFLQQNDLATAPQNVKGWKGKYIFAPRFVPRRFYDPEASKLRNVTFVYPSALREDGDMTPDQVAHKLKNIFRLEAPNLGDVENTFLFDFIDSNNNVEGFVGRVHGKNSEGQEQLFVVFESEAAALQYAFGDLHTGHFQEGQMAEDARVRAMSAVKDGGCNMAERVDTLEKMYGFLDDQRENLKPETVSEQVKSVCEDDLDKSDKLYKKLGKYVNLVRAKSDSVCEAFSEMATLSDIESLEAFLENDSRCQNCQETFRDEVLGDNLPLAA
jgi:hypothetical protein